MFYDWVVLLVNNMVNVQYDWPMNNYELYKVLEEEYDDLTCIPTMVLLLSTIRCRFGYVDQAFYNGQHKINIDGTVTLKKQ